ncbi:hypothetical protein GCM10025868_29360 [Angustibacter aerolatus]|uniref:Cytochrome c oxidase assembly protein n=1 Tax=Angustibacter aerolatus TaxID=1162965 RepID=A0ABQ6JHI0_9ACTN|nr:cytochrome c oxidase assembly protein [Angustibacter aerolatus]GMA87686.1 hypothetical protein GCM10025868_29360 [Angustibacter aerolatus]
MHHEGPASSDVGTLLPLAVLLVLTLTYLGLAAARRAEPRGWSRWRTASLATASVLLALALLPAWMPWPEHDFRGHVLQHLLLGMVAPTFVVLGAPVTLLLRSVPVRRARQVTRVLRSRLAHVLAHPVTALVLTVGGVAALYLTPVYGTVREHEAVHLLVHAHFVASGCLFAWVVAGPDPAPRRPSVPARLVVLGVAIAAHAVLSQPAVRGDRRARAGAVGRAPGRRRASCTTAATWPSLLLAVALLSGWRPRRAAGRRRQWAGSRTAW